MNDDYEKIEDDLKKKTEPEKEQKKSGRSVFKLKEIIEKKSKKKNDDQSE